MSFITLCKEVKEEAIEWFW